MHLVMQQILKCLLCIRHYTGHSRKIGESKWAWFCEDHREGMSQEHSVRGQDLVLGESRWTWEYHNCDKI